MRRSHMFIQNKLIKASANKKQIMLIWIPSQSGIVGNETADKLAKTAVSNPNTLFFSRISYDYKIFYQRQHKLKTP